MIANRLLDELKERLTSAYGHRLHAVVLFGSEARGEAGPDSDIDVLAVLESQSGDYGDELERGLAAVYPVALRLGRRVSVKPLTREEYEHGDSPLVDGGRKRRRGDRVAAVQNGGAQPCSSLRGDDRGDRPGHTPFQREAQECTTTWRFGARYDVRC